MTVDVLSSIKGAKSSETISKLFEVIKNANISSNNFSSKNIQNAVSLEELRDDIVLESTEIEKKSSLKTSQKRKMDI